MTPEYPAWSRGYACTFPLREELFALRQALRMVVRALAPDERCRVREVVCGKVKRAAGSYGPGEANAFRLALASLSDVPRGIFLEGIRETPEEIVGDFEPPQLEERPLPRPNVRTALPPLIARKVGRPA